MAPILLTTRLGLELPTINQALARQEALLPAYVAPVCHHIFAAGGKRLRPFLLLLAARLCGANDPALYDLAVSVEMLHAATLLHDDIIDAASTRRGKAAAHTLFGVTKTILAGDALLACGNRLVASFHNTDLSHSYSTATSETANGEIAELDCQFDPTLPNETYLAIIRGKTAALIRCACEMGAIAAHASASHTQSLAAFGEHIGMAFQLVDDALDFAKTTGKPVAGDLREGKCTYPIRLYRESLAPSAQEDFDRHFRAGDFSEEAIASITQIICDRHFDQATRDFANTYLTKAREALDALPDNGERSLMNAMIRYVADRKQ
ncbi:MAG: polyprenyl synthetase family protein [Desulfovibrio sp.]|nr:polyprenyl synthetase family protein [Desulfovibrio sp.]